MRSFGRLNVFTFHLIVFLCLLSTVRGQCSQYRSIGQSHTMCIYRKKTCANQPLIKSGGLTTKDSKLIVDLHNKLRSKVAEGKMKGLPRAVNMRLLEWDEELSTIAQMWADQCTDGHDKLRDVARFTVGQNVAITWTFEFEDDEWKADPDWESQIRGWFDEYEQHGFPRSQINPFKFKSSVGHFTQVAWGETYKIGCGYAYYKHKVRGYTKIYVCDYGPSGNIIGGQMYQIAKSNSRNSPSCVEPFKSSQDFPGLCIGGNSTSTTPVKPRVTIRPKRPVRPAIPGRRVKATPKSSPKRPRLPLIGRRGNKLQDRKQYRFRPRRPLNG